MSSIAPWWALLTIPPAATILATIVMLIGNSLLQRQRHRQDRIERWEREQLMPSLSKLIKAGKRLLGLPVWPADATGAPAPAWRLVRTIEDSAEWYAFWASAASAVLARDAADKAADLAAVIDDVRATTLRGPHGTMDDAASERHQRAARELAGALDRLALAVRRDHGITVPYAPQHPDGAS